MLDLTSAIAQMRAIEKRANKSKDITESYACLTTLSTLLQLLADDTKRTSEIYRKALVDKLLEETK